MSMDVSNSRSGRFFSVDEAIEQFGHGKFQLLISGFGGFILMADAMEMMILSILSSALICEWSITEVQTAAITSCVFAGMALSSGVWGWFCDRHGRRTGLMVMSLVTFAFAMASAASPNYYVFVVLRTLTGAGIGGMPQSTTYYTEFLPVRHRAVCILLFYIFWSLGSCMESLVALLTMNPLGWRIFLIISTCPLLIAAFLCYFVPETPRFSLTSGKPEEAYKTLEFIANMNNSNMPSGELIEKKAKDGDERMGRFRDLFSRKMVLTTILVWFIWFASMFCYYGLILMMPVILQQNEPNSTNSTNSTCHRLTKDTYGKIALTSLSEIPGLILCAMMFQFLGRKATMVIDFGIFGVFTLLLLIRSYLEQFWITGFMFITRAAINGVFSSVFIYTPEVYPTTMRAVGMGWASGIGRVGALLTPFFAEVLFQHSTTLSICVYGGAGLLAAIAPFFLPIETRGRRLRDRLTEEDGSTDESDFADESPTKTHVKYLFLCRL